jgi:hypothetical protein
LQVKALRTYDVIEVASTVRIPFSSSPSPKTHFPAPSPRRPLDMGGVKREEGEHTGAARDGVCSHEKRVKETDLRREIGVILVRNVAPHMSGSSLVLGPPPLPCSRACELPPFVLATVKVRKRSQRDNGPPFSHQRASKGIEGVPKEWSTSTTATRIALRSS